MAKKIVNLKRRRIVICDDDEGVSEMMKIMLESKGYDVRLLFSGKAIQKRIKEYMPDLILLDIWMPAIDGEKTAKLLKGNQDLKHIPVVIVSALHQNEIKSVVENTGAEGFLLKPFNMSDLLTVAEKFTQSVPQL